MQKSRSDRTAEAAKSRVSNIDQRGIEKRQRVSKQRLIREQLPKRNRQSYEKERPNYAVYRLSLQEVVKYLFLYSLLDGCISCLFFYSWTVFFLLLPGAGLFLAEQKKALQKKRAHEMTHQFLDGIQMLASSLQAGYSVENALREALRELQKMYEPDSFIVTEFRFIDAQIEMSRNIEELFIDFGRRSAIEDIQSFAQVFLTAKRSGGDLLAIIRNTASCIRQKQETMQEIETCLSGKVMEQNIMSLIPILMLAYVKLTSPEFLDAMYGNVTGIAVMGSCFVVYVVAYFWGRRIIQIEV